MEWLTGKLMRHKQGPAPPGPADYCKHQLYLGGHRMGRHRRVKLPDGCRWIPLAYLGERQFRPDCPDGQSICLVLQEDHSAGKGFWSVMSFLSKEEAVLLSEQLAAAAEKLATKSDTEHEEGTT